MDIKDILAQIQDVLEIETGGAQLLEGDNLNKFKSLSKIKGFDSFVFATGTSYIFTSKADYDLVRLRFKNNIYNSLEIHSESLNVSLYVVSFKSQKVNEILEGI